MKPYKKNHLWIALFLMAFGSVAFAQDDVVFATGEDAAAFDNALLKQQNKGSLSAKAAAGAVDSLDVRKEVLQAQQSDSAHSLQNNAQAQNPNLAGFSGGSKASAGISTGGAVTAIGGVSGVTGVAGTAGTAGVTGAPVTAGPGSPPHR
jgi:hypothetical protein